MGEHINKIDLENIVLESDFEKFIKFIKIGFNHVLPLGLDHILFIIAMSLSLMPLKHLLILVTSFTLAHTITLGLSMLGLIEISANIVEPLIALSIAWIAMENILSKSKYSIQRKSIVVFIFGLLHGLGFAYMLKAFDMRKDDFMTTLIGFNVGVELAQVFIIVLSLMIAYLIKLISPKLHRIAILGTLFSIFLVGIYFVIDRLSL